MRIRIWKLPTCLWPVIFLTECLDENNGGQVIERTSFTKGAKPFHLVFICEAEKIMKDFQLPFENPLLLNSGDFEGESSCWPKKTGESFLKQGGHETLIKPSLTLFSMIHFPLASSPLNSHTYTILLFFLSPGFTSRN